MSETTTKKTTNGQEHGHKSQLPYRQAEIIGYHEASKFGGDKLRDSVAHVVQQYPRIGAEVLQGMGVNLGNTQLSYRDWSMTSISTMIALGDCSDQLNLYVEGALRNGVEVEEILDLISHAQAFVGNPRAINALRAIRDTLSKSQDVQLPAEYTETLVRLSDHDTMVRDTHGKGVPMILIHTLSLDSYVFKFVIPMIASATGARVIAYDIRGHGYARGAPLTESLEQLSADLECLLDTLGIDQADVVGSSFGGTIAQTFAVNYQNRVRSLVGVATTCTAPPVLATRATRAEEHGVISLLPETIIRWFHPETIAANPWCVRYARRRIERARLEDWAAAWRAMGRMDLAPRLAELKIPVMALSGTHDASFGPEKHHAIVEACTNADAVFVSVDRGTHMMIMEQPEDVAKELIAFRKKVDGLSGGQ